MLVCTGRGESDTTDDGVEVECTNSVGVLKSMMVSTGYVVVVDSKDLGLCEISDSLAKIVKFSCSIVKVCKVVSEVVPSVVSSEYVDELTSAKGNVGYVKSPVCSLILVTSILSIVVVGTSYVIV